MLDQFSALGAGGNQTRPKFTRYRAGNGIRLLVITSIHQRLIGFGHRISATVTVCAYHNAVRIEEVRHRGALTQELWIGSNIKKFRRSAIEQHDLAHPAIGIDGDGALFHDDLIVVNGAGNSLGD